VRPFFLAGIEGVSPLALSVCVGRHLLVMGLRQAGLYVAWDKAGEIAAGMEWIALTFCAVVLTVHLFSAALAIWRVRFAPRASSRPRITPAVSILRPVCGLDPLDEMTLRSTFGPAHADAELVFCAARANDEAVPLVRRLMAEHPHIRARLLIGDDGATANPKLNNIIKGWDAAQSAWIVIADSNVLMPSDYIEQLFAAMRDDTGLVCSPPIGSRPSGFWAEVECAFLNTYQARWQLAADTCGFGFAQGKSMLWPKDVLDRAGGIRALGIEIAEDAAATKVVRGQGLRVRLVDRPFEQPLCIRNRRQVIDRQVRWARLRRATFQLCYLPEVLAGSLPLLASAAVASPSIGVGPVEACALVGGVWYGAEFALAKAAGWHVSALSLLAWAARDVALPAIWLKGWTGDGFTWRGNDMTVAETRV
jgi:ceramide glucosyltransferase